VSRRFIAPKSANLSGLCRIPRFSLKNQVFLGKSRATTWVALSGAIG